MISKPSSEPNLYLALVHYPVINKNGDIIASAVTNLDLHDIARASATYGIRRFYVVTPVKEQKNFSETIASHWLEGLGASYNPLRKKALCLIRITDSIEEAALEIRDENGSAPWTVATCAAKGHATIGCKECRKRISSGKPCLILFGTAWGLSGELLEKVDEVLVPITGNTGYNHLSVRSAVSIYLDRLLGNPKEI